MKKFVLIAEGMSNESAKKLVNLFKEKGFGFWHYVGDLWLLHTPDSEEIQASWIRDEVRKLGANNCFVTSVPAGYINWAVSSPKNSHEWLHKNWG